MPHVRDRATHRNVLIVLAVTVGLISTFPLFTTTVPYAHDLLFHLARIQSIADGLRSGVFPVRLMDAQAYGFGYPSGMCYPDLLLYLPAALVAIGCDLWVAYVLFVLLVNVGTALIAAYAFSCVFRSERIGLGCCVLWTLSPYRLCDVLLRASVGEYLALMFAPLLVLGLWRLFLDEKSKPGAGWLILAIGASGVVLSHVLSVILLMPPCVLAIIPLALWRRKGGWLLGVAKAAGLSALLCVGFLVPFFSYYLGHDLAVKYFSNSCAINALEPAQLFASFQEMRGESLKLGASLVGEMPLGAGWCLLLAVPSAVLVLCVPSLRTEAYGHMRKWIVLLLASVLVTLFLTTCWFPWDFDGPVLGAFVGALSTVQFPWRLVGVASMLMVLLLGVLASCTEPRARVLWAASLALCIVECGFATNSYLRTAPRATLEEYMQRDPAVGMGEYLPIELSVTAAQEWKSGHVDNPSAGVLQQCERVNPQLWHATVANDTNEEQVVRLPVLWHHQLVLTPQEGAGDASIVYDGGYAGISLAPGTRGTYTVAFVEPIAWRAAEIVSGLTAIATIAIVAYRTKKGNRG